MKGTKRLTSVIIENIPFDYIKKWRQLNSLKKQQIIINRLESTGPISVRQYKELFWEVPYYSKKIDYFTIKEVFNNIKMIFDNITKFQSEIMMSYNTNYKSVKLYHNYTNIDNIIKAKRKLNADIRWVFFDDENIMKINSVYWSLLKPDGTIIKDGSIYFIETDMGTELISVLEEKWKKYEEVINELNLDKNFKWAKLLFFSWKKRIININTKNIFEGLVDNDSIEFFTN